MADPKKMSVADILAAARKQGSVGSGGASGEEPSAEPAAPATPEPAANAPEKAAPAKPAAKPAAPAAKPSGPMSVADILAAARAGKSGGSAPAESPAEPEAEAKPAEKKPAETKPAAAGGAKPAGGGAMSVSDILAAARAGKASAAPAAKEEKPAAKAAPAPKEEKPAAAKPVKEAAPAKAAAADKGGAIDTSSILAAARGGGKPGPVSKSEAAAKPVEAKTKPAVPPMPEKPAYVMPRPAPAAVEEDEFTRRGFVGFFFGSFMATGFTTLALTHLLWLLGLARYMFPNILTEPPSKFRVGKKENFAPGMVENKFKAQYGVWIVNSEYEGEPQIFALRTVCTHLGCTPNWLEAEQKFKCPCHGSGFYKDGINFEGPAPRPLERYAVRVTEDGQLEVDKSKLFFEEKGQWKDPASFVRA